MKAYARTAGAVCAFLLVLLGLVQLLDVPVLTDASPALGEATLGAAAASLALLAGDALLPVPSSGVMVANGALFGPVAGALLSLAGSEAAALVGYAIGRRAEGLLERIVPAGHLARAGSLLARHGALAIVVTRPVPVIAEATTILAGAARLPVGRVALAALAGSLPGAVAYALAGALAHGFGAGPLALAGALLVSGAFWMIARRRPRAVPEAT